MKGQWIRKHFHRTWNIKKKEWRKEKNKWYTLYSCQRVSGALAKVNKPPLHNDIFSWDGTWNGFNWQWVKIQIHTYKIILFFIILLFIYFFPFHLTFTFLICDNCISKLFWNSRIYRSHALFILYCINVQKCNHIDKSINQRVCKKNAYPLQKKL